MEGGTLWGLLLEAFARWRADNVSRMAAAIAYYTIFSVAPILFIVIAVASVIFGEAAARGELVVQLRNLVGDEAAGVIQGMVDSAGHFRSGVAAGVVGVLALVFGATGVFTELYYALNTIWQVPEKGTWKALVKARFLSFLLILAIGLLLLTLLITASALSFVGKFMGFLPGLSYLLDVFNFLLSFAVITFLFAMIYKVLPDVPTRWSDVWAGAAFTSLLFSIGKLLMGLYVAGGRMRSTYGAAGSIILLLFWFYFSAQVLLFGAEFIHVYAGRRAQKKLSGDNGDLSTRGEDG